MQLEQLFERDVARSIEGVIKADDDASLLLELDEYVITDEVGRRLDAFLEAYLNYAGANGVWISGFFGSGKSHLLKMLALLLENRAVDGGNALDVFLGKPKCRDDLLFAANLRRAVAIPSASILFNIDQKADVISKTALDALIAVFVKVFDEHCGYFGKQPYLAQFERELDADGLLGAFKLAFADRSGQDWEWGRVRAKRVSAQIDTAYQQVTGQVVTGILDKYRSDYRLSIEDFAEQVKHYIERQGAGFRLNFFVDEVGQYVADNIKLMTNLQTVAESLATKCNGQAWVIVTAQEDMQNVIGETSKQQGNDFSKIQARFKNRMKLTSQDVAEVIQRRLLQKKPSIVPALEGLYRQHANNFKTLFDFADGAQSYRNFHDQAHFVASYPFVPYQFVLFQAAIQNLSLHHAFEGRHSSVGERSMLGVFQQVAIQLKQHELGELATFDLMFEGIRTALKTAIQQAILKAERHVENPFAVRLLKALFLVKYVKEFKPTVRNLCVLMHTHFERDVPSLKIQVEEALNLLEKETYIQRNGELYEYLTDEEQDIEQEIKNTTIDNAVIAAELDKLIYDGVLKQRKIRSDEEQRDYAFSRRLDDNLSGREYELAINVITSFHEYAAAEEKHRVDSIYKDELVILLPASERLVRDLLMYKQTEKYVAHETRATQQDSIKRILDEKNRQNSERLNQLRVLVNTLMGKAKFFVSGHEIELGGEDGQNKAVRAFQALIKRTYPNLRMLRGVQHNENTIADILRQGGQGSLLGEDASLPESEQEMLSLIQSNHRGGVRTTVKSLLDRFERKPYGWSFAAVLCTLAYLCARGKVEVRESTNLLDEVALARALRNTATHDKLILDPQVEFSQSQLRAVKEFYNDFFERMTSAAEAKALAQDVQHGFKTLLETLQELQMQTVRFPFLRMLEPVVKELKALQDKPYTWFIGELVNQEAVWFDRKEKLIDPLTGFMKGAHKATYLEARQFLDEQKANLAYANSNLPELLDSALLDPEVYKGNKIQGIKAQLAELQQQLAQARQAEQQQALAGIAALQQKLTGFEQFNALDSGRRQELLHAFDAVRQQVGQQALIAVIRDIQRRFEDDTYAGLIQKLMLWSRPKPEPPSKLNVTSVKPVVNEPESAIEAVAVRSIRVPYSQPWLSTEAEVADYLETYRRELLKLVRAGKRIQL
jgi:energy-coupling factor transporter ATP-binding protein EcfA2